MSGMLWSECGQRIDNRSAAIGHATECCSVGVYRETSEIEARKRRQAERMDAGNCPECGYPESRHDGWGGPDGCSLTDYGVALRIHEHRKASTS